jgi:hypothetical protein
MRDWVADLMAAAKKCADGRLLFAAFDIFRFGKSTPWRYLK